MTFRIPGLLAAPLLVLLAASPARALDADAVACGCLDEALNSGDVASCVAMLTTRLVDAGDMSSGERSRMIRDAARGTLALPATCGGSDGPSLEPLTLGFGVEADRPFHPVGGTVQARLMLWNFSPEPFELNWRVQPCRYALRILDGTGSIVRDDRFQPCDADALDSHVVLPGETYAIAAPLPLFALNAETGLPDGTPLPPGVYLLEGTLEPAFSEMHPSGRIPFRIE